MDEKVSFSSNHCKILASNGRIKSFLEEESRNLGFIPNLIRGRTFESSSLGYASVVFLALFLDLAGRAGMKGIQEWLSFYLKSPQAAKGLRPQHDIFVQLMKLKNTLRYLQGEDLITNLGLDYYD